MNYHLKLRQSTGFLGRLFFLIGKDNVSIPDYTTLCRRQKDVPVKINQGLSRGGKLVIGIDSRLKVFGEGVRKHDASVGKTMLKGKTKQIAEFKGDGAYDDFGFWETLGGEIIQTIPPPKNAVIQKPKKGKPLPEHLIQRNEAVE